MSASVSALLDLHRFAGNRAVGQLIAGTARPTTRAARASHAGLAAIHVARKATVGGPMAGGAERLSGGPGRPIVQRAGGSSPPRQARGSRGALVEVVQGLLSAADHPVAIDGIFGRATREAVIAFQGASGLTPDGIVGPRTWGALLEGLGQALDPTSEPTGPEPGGGGGAAGAAGGAVSSIRCPAGRGSRPG